MASLTEQLHEDTKNGMKDAAKTGKKTVQAIGKGIGLIFNATVLSEDAIMNALGKKVEKTGDTSFSYVNVTIEELQKSGKVERIDEPFLKEAMIYFDKYCREYGVKYSALKVTQDAEKNAEDKFIIFFEGKNDKVIEHIIRQAITDWQKEQQNTKENGKEKNILEHEKNFDAEENREVDIDTIKKLLFLLELSNTKEQEHMKMMLKQIDSMEMQIHQLSRELDAAKKQIAQEYPDAKKKMENVLSNVQKMDRNVLQSTYDLKIHIAKKGGEWIANIKNTGELKIYNFLNKAGIQEKLSDVRKELNGCIETLEKNLRHVDSIESELRQGKHHIRNVARLSVGKQAVEYTEKESTNIVSYILRKMLHAYNGMLNQIDKAVFAFSRLENSVNSKNPSVFKKSILSKLDENKEKVGKEGRTQQKEKSEEIR